MKTATFTVPAAAVATMIEGFKTFRTASVPKQVCQFVANLQKALDGYKPTDTGIDVVVPDAGAVVMHKLLTKGSKNAATYQAVFDKINDARAELLYNGVCQCCGRKTDSSVLLLKGGLCVRRDCTTKMIETLEEGYENEED